MREIVCIPYLTYVSEAVVEELENAASQAERKHKYTRTTMQNSNRYAALRICNLLYQKDRIIHESPADRPPTIHH